MNNFDKSPEFEEKIRQALSVPNARPEFVNRLRNELATRPVKMRPRFVVRPAWAIALMLVVIMLIINAPQIVTGLKQLFGYVPDVGLVENTGDLRMLAEPVSVTREGVTLTVKHVWIYSDRVELVYEVKGIEPTNDGAQAEDATIHPTAFCGGVNIGEAPIKDGDALLRLPDGTTLERDYTSLYPENVFAMTPVYKASVPADVTDMTLILKCIPWARLGAVPENWEVPFKLVAVPEGLVVGNPVIDVNATSESVTTSTISPDTSSPSPQVTFTLERVAQTATGPIFYIRLHEEHPGPSVVTVIPRDVYVIDSLGQKIQLMNNTMYSEDSSTVWEYVSTAKPAEGALTLVVADAVMEYDLPNEKTFSFDAGENPQHNQTWELNKELEIANYKLNVISARAVTFSDVADNPDMWNPQGGPDLPEGSQGFDYGYQVGIEKDPSLELTWDILSDSCVLFDIRPLTPSRTKYITHLCRDGYPRGNVSMVLRKYSVIVKNLGQVIWSPGGSTVPVTSVATPVIPKVKMSLERIVPMDSATVFYFSMDMEDKDPSLISIMPVKVYVIDSLGQKIQLIGNFPWQPFEHRVGSQFEFTSQSRPADGPLTLVVENAVAYYAPLYVEPRQATPEEMSFTFEGGPDPQRDQTWQLSHGFEIAGYTFDVTSARAVIWDDVKEPNYIDGSQGFDYGYQFTIRGEPSVKMNVELDILSDKCGFTVGVPFIPESSSLLNTQLCREEYPKEPVTVLIREISVLLENTWQSTWTPINK